MDGGFGPHSHLGDPVTDAIEFRPLGGLETYMATDQATVQANILSSIKRKLPEIEHLPEWGKSKGNEPFAIAGGGPSIKYTVEHLRGFRVVIAAGSSHDWLLEHGIKPTYCLILDPDPASANYIKTPSPTCNYLVASCCDAKVFDALEGYPVTRWHAAGPDPDWFIKSWTEAGLAADDDKPILGGGCTCGLRCITIAMVLGYRNLHFFGMDSSLDYTSEKHHAYDFVDPENEHLGDVVEVRFGDRQYGRTFRVAKYMLAQVWGFQDLLDNYGKAFDVTIHGDGAIAEYMRQRRDLRALEKLNASQEAESAEAKPDGW
jgi:hypothetical protein